ncbi:MAG: PilZ domain-containing protein [Alphaproteobacteria bacterium]|nr:PilZ domain-containing protein [Alphaproteobacteria bacterium]
MRDDPKFRDLSRLLRFDEVAQQSTPNNDSRLLTIFRVGKLTTDRFEELCLIRNVGVGGMLAHVHSPLVARQRVRIELRNDRKFWGNILWIQEGTAGIGFDEQVDIEDILDRRVGAKDNRRSTGPRLNIDCSAKLRVGSQYYGVRVHDLGQSGAGVSFSDPIQNGQDVVLTLEGFRPVQGTVIWSRKERVGIAFNQSIPFHELTRWLLQMFGKTCIETYGGRR